MPIYAYKCEACSSELEVRHGMNEAPPETCSSCGKQNTLKRIFKPSGGGGGFILKGGGWFSQGYTGGGQSSSGNSGEY